VTSRRSARGRKKAPPRYSRHDLYEAAVQEPKAEVRLIDRVYKSYVGFSPKTLREDFCGTAALASAFVAHRKDNVAIGVDLDEEVLAFAKERRVDPAPEETKKRIALIRGDVRDVASAADVLVAFNFSWQVFHSTHDFRGYFQKAARHVRPGGVVMADIWGGAETMTESYDRRRLRGFDYIWERKSFDPITFRLDARIHFEPRGAAPMTDAFVYDWRLRTLPELIEAFEAAGLIDVRVLWEGTNARGGGNGIFRFATRGEACESFVAYVVGRRPERAATARKRPKTRVNRTR
jgi:SAM-dependent methyltransferase